MNVYHATHMYLLLIYTDYTKKITLSFELKACCRGFEYFTYNKYPNINVYDAT